MKFKEFAVTAMAALTAMSFVQLSPAQAQTPQATDVAITMSVSPTDVAITEGTEVDITITLTNVGSTATSIDMPDNIFLPPELTYQSVSHNWANTTLSCDDLGTVPEFSGGSVHEDWVDHRYLSCATTTYVGPPTNTDPGQGRSYTIHTIANADWTNDSTSLFAHHELRPDESAADDVSEIAFIEILYDAADPLDAPTNNFATYTYSEPTTEPTTQSTVPGGSSGSGAAVKPNGVAAGITPAGEAASGEIDGQLLVDESLEESSSSKKVEVARDVKSSLPDRISREDSGAWSAVVNGNNKFYALGGLLALVIVGLSAFFFRKNYLKKANVEKEYRKALKTKQLAESNIAIKEKELGN